MAELLRAEEVAYGYGPALNGRALRPVSLALERGERVLITGPSGSGKSTLARCLTGLIPHLYRGKMQGRVWLDGLPTDGTPLWKLAERAGFVFQNPAGQMLATTVEDEIVFGLENLGLPADTIRERLEEALARFSLASFRRRAPHTLSGGEQQRLALAAILARRPPLLVLDEPLSMLDTTAANDLAEHLAEEAAAGTALVICEHRPEYLERIEGLRTVALPGSVTHEQRDGLITLLPALGCTAAPRLKVSGLNVNLAGRAVLRDLNCTFDGGEVTAIAGRNGVGKTTLLRALAGLQPYQGRISISRKGAAIAGQPDLGLVYQNADLQLFNASVHDEILFRVRQPDMALYEWLIDALGLSAYVATPPLLLSEGEKKRVALATVVLRLAHDGLLLDEPALGQDARHKAMLMGLLRALAAAGRIVTYTTHDLALAAQADRLLLLGPAGFVADGPPAAVLADRGAWDAVGLAVPDWVARSAAAPAQPFETACVEAR